MKLPKKTKVLILTGDLGDGHKQAANAVKEVVKNHRPDIEVEVVDFMKWTHPHLHGVGKYMFVQGIKTFPSVYGYLYRKTRRPTVFSQMCKKIKLFGLGKMVKLLEEVQPSVVVSTFPFAAKAMSLMKMNGLTNIPTVTIITDHTDHSYWIHPYTDQYIVGSAPVFHALKDLDIPDTQIAVTGIPVRPNFCKSYDRDSLRKKHGISADVPTVLIMGGGCGIIGNGVSKLLTANQLPGKMQFIIVCGHNQKLKLQLEEELRDSKHRIKLTGFVDHIHELMAVSDFMITKPGGLTTSEAIALEVPMLLYKPLPGQEQDNAAFLVQAGLAVQAHNIHELSFQLTHLLNHPEALHDMKERARQHQMKQAAFKAVDTILGSQSTSFPLWEHGMAEMYS